ncbi:hypothetical protein NQ317_002055 [Molorchus minor]|uniref:Uncharacterized protein n=1 Tax=Molorchus minor TaxID=1323400 RepID=A0ABQ9JE01_9CUCU|nr:hypothetical protein NQ317_002055 [Molorchus minor]
MLYGNRISGVSTCCIFLKESLTISQYKMLRRGFQKIKERASSVKSEDNIEEYENYQTITESHTGTTSSVNDKDDIDILGENVAMKMRDMTDEQREHTERIIHDIMYYGLMEDLTNKSTLHINDT